MQRFRAGVEEAFHATTDSAQLSFGHLGDCPRRPDDDPYRSTRICEPGTRPVAV